MYRIIGNMTLSDHPARGQPATVAPVPNQPIGWDALPRIADCQWESLHPRHATESLISALITCIALVAAPSFVLTLAGEPSRVLAVLVIGVVVSAVICLYTWLAARRRALTLRQQDIGFRKGLLWHKEVFLIFNRIQHVEITRGPLERLLGLASIKLFTAGGSTADLAIPGLSPERALSLREHVVKTSDAIAD